jgi:AcrR family transcriptional regulator
VTAVSGGTRRRGRPSLPIDEEAVLDSVISALAAHGPGASMHDMSVRCGVAKTTLIDRFGGKQPLVAAAVDRERRRLADHLIAAYAPHRDAIAKEQVERGFQAFFGYAHSHRDAFVVLFGPARLQASDDARAEVTASIAGIISSRFAAAGVELDTAATVLAAVITAAGEAVARLVVEQRLDPDVMATFVADLVVNGLDGLDVSGLFAANAAAQLARRRL